MSERAQETNLFELILRPTHFQTFRTKTKIKKFNMNKLKSNKNL